MTPLALFAAGTLLLWAGLLGMVIGLGKVVRTALTKEGAFVTGGAWLGFGLAFSVLGWFLTRQESPEGLTVPVVWFVMPFWQWAALACLVFLIVNLVQFQGAVGEAARNGKLRSAAGWFFGIFLCLGVLVVSAPRPEAGLPASSWNPWSEFKLEILKGSIPMSPMVLGVLVLLAVGAVFAMVSTARNLTAAGIAKVIVTHAALLVGAFVFGLPFAFLVVTSFKEDRDMSSPNGIVWIPKVQQTVPYFNPKSPLYETQYEGQRVEGVIIETFPDGKVKIDISKPLSIRGVTTTVPKEQTKEIPRQIPLVTATMDGVPGKGKVIEDLEDGRKRVEFIEPASLAGKQNVFAPAEVEPIRNVGLRWQNYTEAMSYMPPETLNGLIYLKNTLLLVILNVVGTILSSAVAAYAFSRLKFPGRDAIFSVLLATLMLPAAVTLLPQFLIFKYLGWVDTLLPLWVPSFFGSAFNIFLLRQFFMGIPMELEDAARVDGCSYLRTFWSVLLPQIKPALAVIAIWTFMGTWNNFMGPLIYINTPENMPLSYALQIFQGDRNGEPGLLMAFSTMAMLPVLGLFFFAQKYFIEGVSLSGLGGR